MSMTRPSTELNIAKDQMENRLMHHLDQGAFKVEYVKNADNFTWDLTAWYVVDQRNQGFDK